MTIQDLSASIVTFKTDSVCASIAYDPTEDLRTAALAENVVVEPSRFGSLKVTFDFLCPNCGKRHWASEYDGPDHLFSTVGWKLKCGWVGVRMPWAVTPMRDAKSIYGAKL